MAGGKPQLSEKSIKPNKFGDFIVPVPLLAACKKDLKPSAHYVSRAVDLSKILLSKRHKN